MTLISTKFDPSRHEEELLESCSAPRIRINAFCETTETYDVLTEAAGERRMVRATVEAEMGSIRSATGRYSKLPSPDLIIVERQVPGDLLLEELDRLAEVCDADTKVIVIGASNDVRLYRDLTGRGVSDYLVAPVDSLGLIGAIMRLYQEENSRKLGRTYAFIGSKGGVGSSTVAHNVAAMMADKHLQDVILTDMDLAFGTAGLDFNLDNSKNIGDALGKGGMLDDMLFERLLLECSDRLSVLAAPVSLDKPYDLNEDDFDSLIDVARGAASHIVLDIPHVWSHWSRRLMLAADEVILTATPDLASLRNTKSLLEALSKARPHDEPPKLVLNQLGVPRRPQIKTAEFAKAVGLDPVATIAFDPKTFGTAENNGQMISDVARRSAAPFKTISTALLETAKPQKVRRSGSVLSRLFPKRSPA